MQGCACPVTGKGHSFKPMMVESIPPDPQQVGSVGINDQDPGDGGFDADDRTRLILAMTTRRYSIVCESCGAIAGGFESKPGGDSGIAG